MDDNQWHQHDNMGAIIMELHNNWKWVVLIKLQLSCNELDCICNKLQLSNSCNLSPSFCKFKLNQISCLVIIWFNLNFITTYLI
jgi:hypothetical protein